MSNTVQQATVVSSKTLSFTLAPDFKGSCKFALAFVPSHGNAIAFKDVVPVAWKVFELNKGGSQTVVWNDNLAGCRATVDAEDKIAVEEYIAVPPGHSTNFVVDGTQTGKKAYMFKPPTRWGGEGNTSSRIQNMSGADFERFGTGFVINDGGKQTMDPVLVTNPVQDGASTVIDYAPELKVWANPSYGESEVLPKAVEQEPIVWEADLSKVAAKRINIQISRGTDGAIKGSLVPSAINLALGKGRGCPPNTCSQVTYTATITFADSNLVSQGMKAIVDNLPCGAAYKNIKIYLKGTGTEATLTLTLPPRGHCKRAAQDVNTAIMYLCPPIYGCPSVKAHSGAACFAPDRGFEYWMEINQATEKWGRAFFTSTSEGTALDDADDEEDPAPAPGAGADDGEDTDA